jgi:beta-aspartyl-peptidase (threonine type)
LVTEQRKLERERALEKKSGALGLGSLPATSLGTVGAVALDRNGNLAAATSTGGLTNKHAGRVGDSPLIGAGTYAENGVCAVSTTGSGEYFIRCATASDLRARIKYRNEHVREAARSAVEEVKRMGGHGGLIAMNQHGDIAMPYSTPSMLRGMVSARQALQVFMD